MGAFAGGLRGVTGLSCITIYMGSWRLCRLGRENRGCVTESLGVKGPVRVGREGC